MPQATNKVISRWQVPFLYRTWVFDQGSLTKRLIEASNNNFRVNIVFQGWAVPTIEERQTLSIRERENAFIREVELLCHDQVWVIARSVIPASTLTGKERQLRHLGNKPLGAFLFKSKVMTRSQLQSVSSVLSSKVRVYGRRSIFHLRNKPLLVTELFMPRVISETRDRK